MPQTTTLEIAVTWRCPRCGAKADRSYDLHVGYLPPEECGNAGCPGMPVVSSVSLTARVGD